jgi:hypothetical protein
MAAARAEGDQREALFYLTVYVFLLRARSEALPIVACKTETDAAGLASTEQACVWLEGEELVLRLRSRKNRQHGSTLRRGCWCSGGENARATCPVHVLGRAFQRLKVVRPFSGLTGFGALSKMRDRLVKLGLKEAKEFVLHDIRRGHARDLQLKGASLWEILQAGEWSSPAFMKYLDVCRLKGDAVVEAHLADSDAEDDA